MDLLLFWRRYTQTDNFVNIFFAVGCQLCFHRQPQCALLEQLHVGWSGSMSSDSHRVSCLLVYCRCRCYFLCCCCCLIGWWCRWWLFISRIACLHVHHACFCQFLLCCYLCICLHFILFSLKMLIVVMCSVFTVFSSILYFTCCCVFTVNIGSLLVYCNYRLFKCLHFSTDRLPEAAFFARTHCPSQVPRVVALWKDKASRGSGNSAQV